MAMRSRVAFPAAPLPRPGTPIVRGLVDAGAREDAAARIAAGQCVAVFVRSVWVLWLDGANPAAAAEIYRIKGEGRIGRPLAAVLPVERFAALLDPLRIAADVRPIFSDPATLTARLGALALLRAPVRPEAVAAVPSAMLSQTPDGTRWIQNCVPAGDEPSMDLARTLIARGVAFPAVTSLNRSGQPEITDRRAAEAFCRAQGIPLMLAGAGRRGPVCGSFPILEVGSAGVRVLREGHFPSYLFPHLLGGVAVQTGGAAPAKYPVVPTHSEAAGARTDPARLRLEILARLLGHASPEVATCAGPPREA